MQILNEVHEILSCVTGFNIRRYLDRRGISCYTGSTKRRWTRDDPGYGYEINKTIESLSGGAFVLKEATLYTAFRRLEDSGLIVSYWGDEAVGARRKYYKITQQGREAYRQARAEWADTVHILHALLEEEA